MPHILFHLGPELPVLLIDLSQWRELRQSLPFARPDLIITSNCKAGADERLREKPSIREDSNDYLRVRDAGVQPHRCSLRTASSPNCHATFMLP
jgi:hypothetical protein